MTGDRKVWGRAIQAVVALVVIAVIFLYFLPRIVDYDDVWATITDMTWLELATLAALSMWNQMTYGLVEMAARPGLRFSQAMKITQSSTALSNTLPGGAALGAALQTAMYVSYRFAPPDVAISMALTGFWNTFVKLGMPVVALSLLALSGVSNEPLVAAAVAGVLTLLIAIALLTVVLRSERGAIALGRRMARTLNYCARLARRSPREDWGTVFGDFRKRIVDLLSKQAGRLTIATVVSHVTLYVVLVMTLRHVGISNDTVGWQEALAAFSFVRLLTALPITPGGLGVVELGLTAALVAAGGDEPQVVAAVLVYRLLTYALPIPLGAVGYLLWRREVAAAT